MAPCCASAQAEWEGVQQAGGLSQERAACVPVKTTTGKTWLHPTAHVRPSPMLVGQTCRPEHNAAHKLLQVPPSKPVTHGLKTQPILCKPRTAFQAEQRTTATSMAHDGFHQWKAGAHTYTYTYTQKHSSPKPRPACQYFNQDQSKQ